MPVARVRIADELSRAARPGKTPRPRSQRAVPHLFGWTASEREPPEPAAVADAEVLAAHVELKLRGRVIEERQPRVKSWRCSRRSGQRQPDFTAGVGHEDGEGSSVRRDIRSDHSLQDLFGGTARHGNRPERRVRPCPGDVVETGRVRRPHRIPGRLCLVRDLRGGGRTKRLHEYLEHAVGRCHVRDLITLRRPARRGLNFKLGREGNDRAEGRAVAWARAPPR